MAPNSTKVLKRHKSQEKFDKKRDAKKHKRGAKEVVSNHSVEEDSDSAEEESNSIETESEPIVYREPTQYDNLLASLGSSNKVVADMNKRRQREEEGKSDSEGDDDEEDEENSGLDDLSSTDGEDDDIQGDGQKTLKGLSEDITQGNNDSQSEEESSDDCETDEEHELTTTNGQSFVDASSSISAFSEHLNHKLSSEEVETLPKGKWKFKWESPAFDMPNCKWKGTHENFLDGIQIDATYGLKPKLYKHWLQLYKKSGGKDFDSSKRRKFFSICNSYLDILHSNKRPFYDRGSEEDSSAMDAYLMHSLNHIFKTRDLVKKNDSKIGKHRETSEEEVLSDDGFLDQGFTRPKVLILLPLRSIAFRVVKRLIQLTPESLRVNVEHLDRFNDEFGCEEGTDDGDEEDNTSKNGKPIKQKSSKPSDWQALFGATNNDDEFMLGIKHTRKSIRLYGDFYSSDIIIASPLKLQMAIGQAEENKERDVDYLSSIEVLVIDHADIISMQNWSFLATVVDHLNKLPSKQHGTNVMRIRPLYLDGHAQFFRQSIILSSYSTPEINSLFNRRCLNYKGKMKLACEYKGVLQKVLLPVRQVFERFDADSVTQVDDARLEHFTKKIFPKIKDSVQGGVMIFIHSYFEFVRLRNFLKSQNASFCLLGEYAKNADISRARERFFVGSRKIMLYTERAYFYRRYQIRGIKNLILYSLPERKEFYPQIMNMLEEGPHDMMSTALFSRFDLLELERIVGFSSAKRMITSEKNIFAFA
ncbi:PREDICTED: U3 small nucleolar RNA-associated protein 25-like isoform X1 [Camelina sativa]|uniref:U3 small nucleolar RNA-associated protein 25-like isoform X1 n=1 Tax=Camelina sativa TaxID=90675 RepID=A0ABM0VPS9_CAMSA|nr:PREDICTED: U3 small nucleolar RNA-associated protein 25-like isoform X1 [Camelina sativa]XP_019090784.1 PREDICTED: U3 small nucleolar RNA-associated protein 25-like isoform X1 [Camelina sativa]